MGLNLLGGVRAELIVFIEGLGEAIGGRDRTSFFCGIVFARWTGGSSTW
jgi:hypothetical protein